MHVYKKEIWGLKEISHSNGGQFSQTQSEGEFSTIRVLFWEPYLKTISLSPPISPSPCYSGVSFEEKPIATDSACPIAT